MRKHRFLNISQSTICLGLCYSASKHICGNMAPDSAKTRQAFEVFELHKSNLGVVF